MSKTPCLMGDSMMTKSFKPAKDHHRRRIRCNKAKGFTFMASLFSFFICTSIFYILNHSPDNLTSLFSNNVFWFFMSNTLILIIAADYEAFSSSSKTTQDHHYEEYVKHSNQSRNYNHYATSSPPSYVVVPTTTFFRYEQVDEKQCVVAVVVPPFQEKKEEDSSELVPERVLEIVPQNEPKKSSSSSSPLSKEKPIEEDSDTKTKACEEKTLYPAGRAVGRSKSDRYGHVKRVVIDEGKNRVIRRAETMKVEEERVEEENNEFSSMSNEELNRRVEEFIQRFNRQIRLQAVRNNSSVVHEA